MISASKDIHKKVIIRPVDVFENRATKVHRDVLGGGAEPAQPFINPPLIYNCTRYSKLHESHFLGHIMYQQNNTLSDGCEVAMQSKYKNLLRSHKEQVRHIHSDAARQLVWLLQFKPTSKSKASRSIGIVYLRAKFCITPVRNAWVKKNPEIQKTLGLSFSNQFCK